MRILAEEHRRSDRGTRQGGRQGSKQSDRQSGRRSEKGRNRGNHASRTSATASRVVTLFPELLPRKVALDVLLRVSQTASFANLILPKELSKQGVAGQEAAFVTDAVYGTLRWRGLLDEVVAAAAKRSLEKIDATALEVLRLGAFEVLFMEVPDYAAVSSSVDLVRAAGRGHLTGFVNAVIRKIAARGRREWEALVVSRIPKTEPLRRAAVRYSHPAWIVAELQKAWEAAGYEGTREGTGASVSAGNEAASAALADILTADNRAADVTLVARPGLVTREELRSQLPEAAEAHDGLWSPYALRVKGVQPGRVRAVAKAWAGVEDEGSQLAALALAAVPVAGVRQIAGLAAGPHTEVDAEASADMGAETQVQAQVQEQTATSANESVVTAPTHRWLDLCAGPGGKAALLGALAAGVGAKLVANEPSEHRAQLVRENLAGLPEGTVEKVTVLDGRVYGELEPESFDQVLVDAPCSGLGALRRRPEARWVKKPEDIADLVGVQKGLLASALAAVRPGGVVAYVTCSPVLAETREVVEAVVANDDAYSLLDTPAILRAVAPNLPLPATGNFVQLFSHLHDTDQMFIALIRRLR